jgi:cell division protein FtsB
LKRAAANVLRTASDFLPWTIALNSALLRRLIWNVLPAALVLGALYMTVAGEAGLLARHRLQQQVVVTELRVDRVQDENTLKRLRIDSLRGDPDALRREAAEQLLVAAPGSTVYRLD